MYRARFQLRIPEYRWIGEFSREFPTTTVRLFSSLEVDSKAVQLGTMTTEDPETALTRLERFESVVSVDVLEQIDETVFLRCETTDTELYRFFEQFQLPPEYPISVRDGWAEIDVTGTHDDVEQFRTTLDDIQIAYKLVSLVETDDATGLLTDRQRAILETAIREGYLEVPRDCTLEEVAAIHDIDKATASELVRRAQATVVKWYLTGSEGFAESSRIP